MSDYRNQTKQNLKALFEELGGEDLAKERVREILNKFYKVMAGDLMVGFFFSGKDISHIASQQAAFLLRAMGTGEKYVGPTPFQAHKKIAPIRKGHFDRRLVLLSETLKKEGVSDEGIKAWVGFEEQFRALSS